MSFNTRGDSELQDLTGFSSTFQHAREDLDETLVELRRNTAAIQRSVDKLGTHSDTPNLRAKLMEAVATAKETAMQASVDLRRLKKCGTGKAETAVVKEAEQTVSQVMGEFKAATQQNAKRQRQLVEAEREMGYDGAGEGDHLLQSSALDDRAHELDWNEQLAEERKKEIHEIETTVVEIYEIFKDLDVLVNDQDPQIQQIDANIERGRDHVEEGTEQLRQANRSANRSRKLKCWFLFFLLLVVGVVVLWGTQR